MPRMLRHERLELPDHSRVPAEREVRVDPILQCPQPLLLEPARSPPARTTHTRGPPAVARATAPSPRAAASLRVGGSPDSSARRPSAASRSKRSRSTCPGSMSSMYPCPRVTSDAVARAPFAAPTRTPGRSSRQSPADARPTAHRSGDRSRPTSPRCSTSTANSARCLGPPIATGRSCLDHLKRSQNPKLDHAPTLDDDRNTPRTGRKGPAEMALLPITYRS